jgi:hypothetical protein
MEARNEALHHLFGYQFEVAKGMNMFLINGFGHEV